MDRAISINVNPRNRCTAEVTRLTQNHNLPAICAHFTHTAGVHRGKGDRLHLRSRAPKPRTAPWLQGVRIYETTSNQNDESVVFRTSK